MSKNKDFLELKKTFEIFIKSSQDLKESYKKLKNKSSLLSLYLSNILESIDSSILVFDNFNNLQLWNSKSFIFFPKLKNTKAPIAFNDIKSCYKELVIKDIINHNNSNQEIIIKSDENIWLNIKKFHLKSSEDINSGLILMIEDISNLKKLQLKSMQEDRLRVMGELAAEMAHEIRNPLAGIELMMTLLQEDIKDESALDIIRRVKEGINSMNHIVSNTLTYTKEIIIKPEKIQLKNLVDECYNTYSNLINKKEINFQISSDDNLTLYGDYQMLKQSIGNIILNALQATLNEGKVCVKAKEKDNKIMIEISDTGKGISKDLREKIFRPFYTTKNTGTGLGLAMVKRVIDSHRGTIDLKSSSKGSTFIISLPNEIK